MLPPATETLWHRLKTEPALTGFFLIVGSALALKIKHRLSEDLDFCTTATSLPRKRLSVLRRDLENHGQGYHFEPNDDAAALDEFTLAGMELHDYQQDFVVNKQVKVSFFTADGPTSQALEKAAPPPKPSAKGPILPNLGTLFVLKALVSSVRSKTRDWFDLYILMTQHGFSPSDYVAAFEEAGIEDHWENGISRLCSATPAANDEGFMHLVENPPSTEEMAAYFRTVRDRIEVERSEGRM